MERIPNVEFQIFARDADGCFGNVEEVLREESQVERFEYSEEVQPYSAEDNDVISQLKRLLPPAVNLRLDVSNSPLLIIAIAQESDTTSLQSRCQCQCGTSGSCGGGGGGQ